jgi:hemerythrin-like domain-containing protein
MPESPTRQLADEHEYVLLVVGAMEAEAARIEKTGTVDVERVTQMVDFTRNFTDGDHHTKEENLLFPLLEERSPAAGGTVSVLLSEHEAARDCIRAISSALPDAAGEDEERAAAGRAVVAENLRSYAYLLPLHIGKEDTVLFKLTDELLSPSEQEILAREFEDLGEAPGAAAVTERYHRLAHDLAGRPADSR